MVEDAFAVEIAECVAGSGHGGAAGEPETGIAGGLELRASLLGDALDVAHGEEAPQPVLLVHHQQLVNAWMVVEELVGPGDRVRAQLLLSDRSEERRVGKECRSRWS